MHDFSFLFFYSWRLLYGRNCFCISVNAIWKFNVFTKKHNPSLNRGILQSFMKFKIHDWYFMTRYFYCNHSGVKNNAIEFFRYQNIYIKFFHLAEISFLSTIYNKRTYIFYCFRKLEICHLVSEEFNILLSDLRTDVIFDFLFSSEFFLKVLVLKSFTNLEYFYPAEILYAL